MRSKILTNILLLIVLAVVISASVLPPVSLAPGDSVVISCSTRLTRVILAGSWRIACAPLPATATATLVPGPTDTPTPTSIVISTLTPTPTQSGSGVLDPVDPIILGTCSAAVHDSFAVTGPDGTLYRTWHPQIVTVNGVTCRFAHEHGDDPRTSVANNALPPFNYVGLLAGMNEPHEGFKVFVSNQGTSNNEGGVAQNSTRVVAHMGTGGAGRFGTQFHSLMFDLISGDGHEVHIQGMSDTGSTGDICHARVGKTVTDIPGAGCAVQSLYEIWNMQFSVHTSGGNAVTVITAPAVFDPISLYDPANPTSLNLTSAFYPGQYFGCTRENYAGPVYWYNAGGPTVYHTDVMGMVMANGPLTQFVSSDSALGIRMSSGNFYQMKLGQNSCASGLGIKN